MNIHLVGAVGGKNFGDELILNICQNQYSSLGYTNFSYSGFDKDIVLIKGELTDGINFFDIMFQLRALFHNIGSVTENDILQMFEQYPKIDIIHFVGGGYMNSLWHANYALLAIAKLYAHHYNIPIFATGSGLYPILDDAKIYQLFNSLNIIDVRDRASHDLISSSSYTGDDVLLTINSIKKKQTDPALIISVQHHLFEENTIMDYIFSPNYLSQLTRNNIHNIIVVEASPLDTVEFNRKYIQNASRFSVKVSFTTGEHLILHGMPYNPHSKVIASRFHIHLLYSMLDLEGIALYDNEYYLNKHGSVNEIGSNWLLTSRENAIKTIQSTDLFSGIYKSNKQKFSELSVQKEKLFTIIKDHKKDSNIPIDENMLLEIINANIG